MLIEAKGIVRNPNTGKEEEVTVQCGLHGAVDTALAKATVNALIATAKRRGYIPVRVEGLTATTETEWRPDHFPDLMK